MRRGTLFFKLLVLLLVLVTGCSNQSSESKADRATMDERHTEMDQESSKEEMSVQPVTEPEYKASDNGSDTIKNDRMFIYHANLSIQVKKFHSVEAEFQQKAIDLGGYVVESSTYDAGTESINGTIVIKIPQSHFQSYINDVEKNSIKVVEKSISGNDVTEEFVDLESRLKAKEAVEQRLLTLMDQAEKTEDLLKISNDLSKVQEEKEQILGRMNYLKNNVDYSTVTIHLEEELVKIDSIKDNSSLNTWQKAKSLFVNTINGIISVLSGLVVFVIGLSPIILPIVAILIAWFILRKKKKQE
ncbi:DUF4349 domain-containing protein [Bacillus sp. REN16]|uniref:DUF4349 domain-containing protein n=1 Tax=Bacillus sp. REN16 TaxID=2887296 RepID=UPI001E504C24|nr:DUF4349 domain-containing protein [Bacillus sp. REN16]MCC3357742.1 DUF4349 domain-containing protein [Bacillus sp. REN16]